MKNKTVREVFGFLIFIAVFAAFIWLISLNQDPKPIPVKSHLENLLKSKSYAVTGSVNSKYALGSIRYYNDAGELDYAERVSSFEPFDEVVLHDPYKARRIVHFKESSVFMNENTGNVLTAEYYEWVQDGKLFTSTHSIYRSGAEKWETYMWQGLPEVHLADSMIDNIRLNYIGEVQGKTITERDGDHTQYTLTIGAGAFLHLGFVDKNNPEEVKKFVQIFGDCIGTAYADNKTGDINFSFDLKDNIARFKQAVKDKAFDLEGNDLIEEYRVSIGVSHIDGITEFDIPPQALETIQTVPDWDN